MTRQKKIMTNPSVWTTSDMEPRGGGLGGLPFPKV